MNPKRVHFRHAHEFADFSGYVDVPPQKNDSARVFMEIHTGVLDIDMVFNIDASFKKGVRTNDELIRCLAKGDLSTYSREEPAIWQILECTNGTILLGYYYHVPGRIRLSVDFMAECLDVVEQILNN